MSANAVYCFRIEDYIKEMARISRLKSVYPETISRKLNIPIDVLFAELMTPKYNGKIQLKFEIKCLDDLNTITTVDSFEELIGQNIFCVSCAKDIVITYNNIYPVFYFDKTYKEYLKNEKKK